MSKKNILILIVFTLLFTIASYGQEAKGFYMKNKNATIYFRDGTTLEGLAKITSFNEIKFRKSKKDKKKTYDSKSVYKLIIHKKDVDIEYHYKIVFERPNPILLEVVVKGRLTLYKELQVFTYSTYSSVLYITKNDSDLAKIIGYTNFSDKPFSPNNNNNNNNNATSLPNYIDLSKYKSKSKRFKKELLTYIEDCPNLVKLIQNKKYKDKTIEWIVKYYNEHCGKDNIASQEESTDTEIKD